MDYENIWSVNDIVKNRNNWSLAADSELLKHLQHLSKSIIDKSRSTLELLESLENDVDRTCLSVANTGNRFKSLSDTQFIENKIQESPETELVIHEELKASENKDAENVSVKLKEALNNGLNVLSSHYDVINVSDSDSENEEPQEILLKSCNPFIKRRLPYIIGTNDFTKYDHLGLADSSSDDEEEDDELAEEPIDEEQPYDRIDVLSKKNITNIATTQIIQISSSDSEDSDISAVMDSPRDSAKDTTTVLNHTTEGNLTQSSPKVAYSFADHLSATLSHAGVKKPTVIPDYGHNDLFSPPPFSVKGDNNFSSDEEESDSSNSVSRHNPVISRSLPATLPTACSKPNVEISDELFSNDSSTSGSVKNEERTRNISSDQVNASCTSSIFGPDSEVKPKSELNNREEKKLSHALADEFKSKILAKNKPTPTNRNATECNPEDSKSSSKTSSKDNKIADSSIEKRSATSKPFHNPSTTDVDIDRAVSSNKQSHQSTLVPTAAEESSKSSWFGNNADDEDDDDDDDDEWFNRAVSSKTQPNKMSSNTASASVSSKLPSLQNEPSVKDPVKDVFFTDSKTDIDRTSTVNEKPVSVTPQTKITTTEVDNVEKRYSLFGSDSDNDDDDLFTKKTSTVSDKNKTDELYDILFNDDSDVDDPIQALVEENKRRVGVKKSTESKIFDDSEIINKPVKDSAVPDRNYSSPYDGSSTKIVGSSESVLQSNSSADEKNMPNLLNVKTGESLKSGLSFLQSNPDEPTVKTVEKKEINSENIPSSSANLVAREENDEDQLLKKLTKNHDPLSDSSISKFGSKNSTSKISDGMKNPVSSDSAIISDLKSSENHQSASIIPFQTSSDSGLDESSQTTSEKSKISVSPSSGSGSNTSENNIHSDNATNLDGRNSCEKNIVTEEPSPNVKTKPGTEEASPNVKTKPGKLAIGRGVNVNVNALLPTSKWSKSNVKTIKTGESSLDGNEDDSSDFVSKPVQSNLSSATKDRAKIPSKRRPPTRRGRIAQINAESSVETSVTDKTEPARKELDDDVQDVKPVTFSDPSPRTSIHLEHSPNVNPSDVVPISATAEDTSTTITRDGATAKSKVEDVNSIFDAIFGDDDDTDVILNAAPAVGGPANVYDSLNEKDLFEKSSESSSRVDKVAEENLFTGRSKNSQISSISGSEKAESSNSSKITDSPKKPSLFSESFDEDDFIVTKASRNNDVSESLKNSQKADPLSKKEKEQTNRFSRTAKNEATGGLSNFKSDLFADDEDEDFNQLFSAMKKPQKSLSSKKSSLFADVDDDDEDLFGVKTSSQNRKKTN